MMKKGVEEKMGRSHTVHMSNKNHSIANKKKLVAVFCHNLRKYLKNSENYNKELKNILTNFLKKNCLNTIRNRRDQTEKLLIISSIAAKKAEMLLLSL